MRKKDKRPRTNKRRKPTKAQLKKKRKGLECAKRQLINDIRKQYLGAADQSEVLVQDEVVTEEI